MKPMAARIGALLTLFALASCPPPAQAQLDALGPAFSRLSGGFIWGSVGYRDIQNPEHFHLADRHPAVRGGFAALYGPFGGQPDTTVTLDSVRTMVEWMERPPQSPGATRVDTIRSVRIVHSRHTIPGRDGWISLAVGYHYAGTYQVDLSGPGGDLVSTFPVGGFYAAANCGPFRVPGAPHALFWQAGLGAGLAQLHDANGTSDTALVRFDTECALGRVRVHQSRRCSHFLFL